MSHYEALLAYGFPPELAARDAYANELLRFQNREHENYGRQYEGDQIADAAPSTDYYERG